MNSSESLSEKEFCLGKELYLAAALADSIDDCNLSHVEEIVSRNNRIINVIVPDSGFSALHFAVGSEDQKFAELTTELLLSRGGDPNVRGSEGVTCLHIAAAWGRTKIMFMLLENGGNKCIADLEGKTALDYAYEESKFDIVDILMNWKETVPRKIIGDISKPYVNHEMVKILKKFHESHDLQEKEGVTRYNPPGLCDIEDDVVLVQEIQKPLRTENYVPTKKRRSSVFPITRNVPCIVINSSSGNTNSVVGTGYEGELDTKTPTVGASTSNVQNETTDIQQVSSSRVQEWINTCHFSPKCSDSDDEMFFSCDNTNNFEPGICKQIQNKSNDYKQINDDSLITVSTQLRIIDGKQNLVLLEEEYSSKDERCDLPNDRNEVIASARSETETIDTANLRQELQRKGYKVGPVTATTKQVYKKKLKDLNPSYCKPSIQKVYCYEMKRSLQEGLNYFFPQGSQLEQGLCLEFAESIHKSMSFFTYLLLDPRVTNNLPIRAPSLSQAQIWSTFINAIFYVGKGKRARPYNHLYDAIAHWRGVKDIGRVVNEKKKIKRILDVWKDGSGIICIQVFQGIVSPEAFTREAAMIDALGVENLCNMCKGKYYGKTVAFSMHERKILGIYLLYKAMQIFLLEGERQLKPYNIE